MELIEINLDERTWMFCCCYAFFVVSLKSENVFFIVKDVKWNSELKCGFEMFIELNRKMEFYLPCFSCFTFMCMYPICVGPAGPGRFLREPLGIQECIGFNILVVNNRIKEIQILTIHWSANNQFLNVVLVIIEFYIPCGVELCSVIWYPCMRGSL